MNDSVNQISGIKNDTNTSENSSTKTNNPTSSGSNAAIKDTSATSGISKNTPQGRTDVSGSTRGNDQSTLSPEASESLDEARNKGKTNQSGQIGSNKQVSPKTQSDNQRTDPLLKKAALDSTKAGANMAGEVGGKFAKGVSKAVDMAHTAEKFVTNDLGKFTKNTLEAGAKKLPGAAGNIAKGVAGKTVGAIASDFVNPKSTAGPKDTMLGLKANYDVGTQQELVKKLSSENIGILDNMLSKLPSNSSDAAAIREAREIQMERIGQRDAERMMDNFQF